MAQGSRGRTLGVGVSPRGHGFALKGLDVSLHPCGCMVVSL